ncbi:MAG: SCO family protein [Gemmatimonadetes bacterium]|nr:SCO family protein [Gemmatimonadota bacterium]
MMSIWRAIRILSLAVGSTVLAACSEKLPPLHGVVFDPADAAPALRIARVNGAPFDLATEQGHVVLLYFGYTHCPDICPATLSDWAKAKRTLGKRAEQVRFVFVSVDPERDTPAVSAAYTAQFDSTFIGLTATAADLATLAGNWHFAVMKEETGTANGYGMSHPAQSYVIDREGRVRMLFPPATRADDIASDLRHFIK